MDGLVQNLTQNRTTEVQPEQEWRGKWLTPILDAMYSKDLELARRSVLEAGNALCDSNLTGSYREKLAYELRFLQLAVHWQIYPDQWDADNYYRALADFNTPALTELGEQERIRRRFIIRTHADKDKIEPLAESAITELLEVLPSTAIDATIWHYIAGWAFSHNNLPLIERAFEALLTYPSDVLGQAKWQRVNLMYQLMTGKVTRRDVAESIRLLSIKPQLQEFLNELWPACVKAGVVDEELEELLRQQTAGVEASSGLHRNEPRTRSIRGNNLE